MSERSICYGEGLFELCERAKRGEIVLYSVAVGASNAQWIVTWAVTPPKPVKAEQGTFLDLLRS